MDYHPACYFLRDIVDELTLEVMAEVVEEGIDEPDGLVPQTDEEIASFDLNELEIIQLDEHNNIVTVSETPLADDGNGNTTETIRSSIPAASSIPVPPREFKRKLQDIDDQDIDCSDYLKYIKKNKNTNTNRKTDQVVRRVKKWLKERHGETRVIEDLTPNKLNFYLCDFFMTVKKEQPEGTDITTLSVEEIHYQPDTLTSYFAGVARYLKEHKYEVNLMSHTSFEVCRGVLATRRGELFAMGLGNKPNAAVRLTDDQIEECWNTGAFGSTDPRSLQSTLYYYFCQAFGWRPRDEPYHCYWEDIYILEDNETRYIEWNERASKTRKGQKNVDPRHFNPKLWELGTDRCCLPLYELYRSKRPADFCKPGVKFFLTPKPKANIQLDDVCYSREEMGIGSIGIIMKKVASKAKLHGNIKGHSVRKTSCSNLMEQNVPPNIVAQLSGHASLQSLQHYTTASIEQQHHMSDILVGGKRPAFGIEARKGPSVAASSAVSAPVVSPVMSPVMQPVMSPSSSTSPAPAPQALQAPGTPPLAVRPHGSPSRSSSGMFYGATFNGPVNIHMHYGNVASQSQVHLSPQMSVKASKPMLPLENDIDGHIYS